MTDRQRKPRVKRSERTGRRKEEGDRFIEDEEGKKDFKGLNGASGESRNPGAKARVVIIGRGAAVQNVAKREVCFDN